MAQRLKHLPGMQETWVPSLGWEDPLVAKSRTQLSHLTFTLSILQEITLLTKLNLKNRKKSIKSWFFEKINKVDKTVARLIKRKRELK